MHRQNLYGHSAEDFLLAVRSERSAYIKYIRSNELKQPERKPLVLSRDSGVLASRFVSIWEIGTPR